MKFYLKLLVLMGSFGFLNASEFKKKQDQQIYKALTECEQACKELFYCLENPNLEAEEKQQIWDIYQRCLGKCLPKEKKAKN